MMNRLTDPQNPSKHIMLRLPKTIPTLDQKKAKRKVRIKSEM